MTRMNRTFGFALAIWLLAATGHAEVRFYLVPMIGNGQDVPLSELSPTTGNFRPKYTDPGVLGPVGEFSWSGMPYPFENVYLLGADVTPEQHAALSAQADVLAVPNALDSNVSALAVTTIQSKLEAINVPAEWVTTSLTYRQVLRRVGKIIQFAQRHRGLHALRLLDGMTLDTRWNQLTEAQRTRLRSVADSFGIDYSGVTNTMTLREILRFLADQLPSFVLKGETL